MRRVPAPLLSQERPTLEEAAGDRELVLQSQAQLRRRVERMFIERALHKSERLAFDERVDMRTDAAGQHLPAGMPPTLWPTPLQMANVLAYVAVVSYEFIALLLTWVYSVHLSSRDSLRWLYSCFSSWIFTWFVLELLKPMLLTMMELQELSQRRRHRDLRKLRDQVFLKKAKKMKKMGPAPELLPDVTRGPSVWNPALRHGILGARRKKKRMDDFFETAATCSSYAPFSVPHSPFSLALPL